MATTNPIPGLRQAASLSIKRAVADSLAKNIAAGLTEISVIAERYARDVENKKGLEQVNRSLAADMHRAMLRAFEEFYGDGAKSTPSYRIGENRLSGGILRRVLRSETQAVGTKTGIGYIDANLLDREARHWRRLNFGAEGTGVFLSRPGQYSVKFGKASVGPVGFPSSFGPSPPFFIPEAPSRQGFGFRVGRGFAFFPGRPTPSEKALFGANIQYVKQKLASGIPSTNFLDAGFRSLSANFSNRYTKWIEDTDDFVSKKKIVTSKKGKG